MYNEANYPVAQTAKDCTLRTETIRERLERQLRIHTEQVESVKAALKFMDENSNFENFHNLITKIGY